MPPRSDVVIDYTNHRAERSKRTIIPKRIIFTNNMWHTKRQWLLEAWDIDKGMNRTFALADVHSWEPMAVTLDSIEKET